MISDSYKQSLQKTHEQYAGGWGTGGNRHASIVRELIAEYDCKSVLDYGCGQARLGNILTGRDKQSRPVPGISWTNYDPGMPRYSRMPNEPVDLLVSTHALEHVEPEHLDSTLQFMSSLCRKVAYICLPHGPAKEFLADGRNAHLTQEPPEWWLERLSIFGKLVRQLPPKIKRIDGCVKDETRWVFAR